MVVPGDVELKLTLGAMKSVTESIQLDPQTIRKISQRALKNFNNADIESSIFSQKKKENSRRFFVYSLNICIFSCFMGHRMNKYTIHHHVRTFCFDWLYSDPQPLHDAEIIPIATGND
jgi:hypothetical protein